MAIGKSAKDGNKRAMKQGYLSQYFTGAGTKILTRVDATAQSNQHEIGDGPTSMKLVMGNRVKP